MGLKSILKKVGLGAAMAAKFTPAGQFLEPILSSLKGAGLIKDPEAEEKARALLEQHQIRLAELDMEFVKSVNSTYRAEIQSGSAWQRGWRPMVGYTFAAVIVNNYIVLPYFPSLEPIAIPPGVWTAMLMVLGIAAGTRGIEKWQKAKNDGGKSGN